jgi:uncharacterized protein (TIGR02217 family)
MTFFDQRFDERLSFGARGGPVWKTTVVVARSGKRYADKVWQYPLHRYQVGHAIKDNADFEVVRAFFYNVSGAYDGFRFKDWADFEATQANSGMTALAGSPSEWQLERLYTVGNRTFRRRITRPVQSVGIIVRRYRGSTWSTATLLDADYSTGHVQISDHQNGDVYAWIGQFDVPCCFADDEMEAEIVDAGPTDYLMSWPSVVIEEIREP